MIEMISIFAGNGCLEEKSRALYFGIAYELGLLLGKAGLTVVTGAGDGLMEEVSRGAHQSGGRTIGIGLDIENKQQSAHVSKYEVYKKLGARQDKLIELGQAYIALPGGIGTYFEIFNILALKRLKEIPNRPLILVGEYYRPLESVLDSMLKEGFVGSNMKSLYNFVKTPNEALEIIKRHPEI